MPTPITFGAISARAFGFLGKLKAITDAYFKYVTLLLHGDGTNGAQNNTFLDGSTNNFTITRNGNTTQGSFSPFSQTGWSNYFDGTGDYLVPTSSTIADFGTGDFSVEMFVNLQALGSERCLLDGRSAATDNCVLMQITTGNLVGFGAIVGGAVSYFVTSTSTVPLGAWTHVAVTRSGTSLRLFFNGELQATATNSTNFVSGTNRPTIGATGYTAGANVMLGYISNLRIVKGTAVYTSNFTPPTAPLTAITNTSLLTCQSNRFIDNSSNAFAITRNGDVRVEAFSPFNPSTTYSTANVGGSGYFDGTGDYLASTSTITLGTNAFTIEFWVYANSIGAATMFVAGTTTNSFQMVASGANLAFGTYNVANVLSTTTSPFVVNQWLHIVYVRSGTGTNQASIFVNGVRAVNGTVSTNYVAGAITVGGFSGGQNVTGYMSDVRVVNGTAVYDPSLTTLTVPTAPLTAITNTSLLLNFTNGGIFDNASQTVLETVGNAQISTAQAKFGGASMYFDGTGDWLTAPDRPAQRFGTADFTVEGWLYLGATGAARGIISKGTASTGWSVNVTSGNKLQFSYTASNLTGVTSLSASTWYYFTAMRTGGSIRVYLNGTQEVTNSTAITDNFNQTNILYVGANRTGGDALNGYLDDIRITNGYARYNNFTVPSAALTPTAYTAALPNTSTTNGAQNNTFLDGSTNNFTITRNGNTTQGTFSPFSNSGWSNYFDGSGDSLQLADNAAFEFGSGDFTLEAWIRPTAYATLNSGQYNSDIISKDQTSLREFGFYISGTASSYTALNFIGFSSNTTFTIITGTQAFDLGVWYHVAAVRSGNNVYLYVNGVQVNSTTAFSQTIQDTASVVYIGARNFDASNQYYFPGYISNLRIVKGTAVYTANFTPPTAPLTAITNTSLLTCQSNRFIDNSTNAFAITRNGDVSVQAFSPFTPAAYSSSTNGGSGYFDGTGDYLSAAGNTAFDFGTGDFTVEAWVYLPATQTQFATIACQASTGNAWYLSFGTGNTVTFSNYTIIYITSSSAVSNNTWSHVAVSRSGTSLKMFINGSEVGSATNSVSLGVTANLFVGFNNATHYFNGYLSNLRIVKGTAVYTSNFTPPTAPLTAIANTSLLLNFTNAGIFDAVGINNYETVGNAQASTTQAKFGTTSMYFDGTDDRLVMPARPPLAVGSGNFTIEGWVYRLDTNVRGVFQLSGTTGGLQANTTTNLALGTDTGAVWRIYCNNNAYNSTATWVINTWYHFALVRNGATTTLYINGTSVISQSDAVNYTGQNLCIGGYYSTSYLMNGYIDDLRITPGQALYPGNFTPPTAPFPNN